MQIVLMVVAGAGLLGCFVPTLKIDFIGGGQRHSGRRLARPKRSQVARDAA